MQYINKHRLLALFLVLTLLFTAFLSYAQKIGNDISNSVMRLHIIANSNTETDQSMKLRIRNRVLSETQNIFTNAQSTEETISQARKNISLIRKIAEDEVERMGFDYKVKVTIGRFPFPTKNYGNLTLPAGKYNAVRIELGEAQGKNWWCVLYPPLCFTDGVLSASSDAMTKLENSLSEDEFSLISQKTTPVKVRFKIVEVFQNLF
ncbi:MAG: stage II sporulation protein R [Clostridia bacterium]|nr:stage II sporulation protein R [Clostridia bacterium]